LAIAVDRDHDSAGERTIADSPRSKVGADLRDITSDVGSTTRLLTPTVPEPVTAPTRSLVSPASDSRRRLATPGDALDQDEVARTRTFLWFMVALAVIVNAALPLAGGDARARLVHHGGLTLLGIGSLALQLNLRRPERFRPAHVVALGHVAVITVTSALYFWGALSAALLVVPFGAFLFALGRSFGGALSILLHCLVAQAALTILQAAGVLADRGVIRAVGGLRAQIVTLVLVQLVIGLTFAVARSLRASSERTMGELQAAAREVAAREAVLAEARQELEHALAVGGLGRYSEQVVGPWRLGAVLGRGAMGEVYEAVHVTTGAPAAVKLLHPRLLGDPDHVRRFLRESQVAASLSLPNVVAVREVAEPSASIPYIAMERLEGQTLAQLLKRTITLPVADTVELVAQVAGAVDAAHAAGIVHRDLKPQNLYRCEGPDGAPVWKVLDFGASKLLDQADMTRGGIIGTPSYMAPEQARGEAVDGRADVYALGVIAYRCLTGQAAFPGEDVPAVVYAVVHTPPRAPSRLRPVPEDVELVLALALQKDPARRLARAGELAQALAAAATGQLPENLRERARQLLALAPWAP
jgi:serine/threonine-protein kinase